MYIKRSVFPDLVKHLSQKEISLVIGPRQAGKTTLLLNLKDYLVRKGKKTLFLSLDNEIDRKFFKSQLDLIKRAETEFGRNHAFVFADEIQRKENAGIFLKGIYDMNLPYKFIVSGSGSLELKEKIHESLMGRKRVFEVPTISFKEFVDFKTGYKYRERLSRFMDLDNQTTKALLSEYLNFGGYPRIVTSSSLEEKYKTINEIYQTYLEKDISYFLNVRKTEDFSNLIKLLASQAGNLVNITEIANTLGINLRTVKQFLWYLENTFIVQRVTPFFRNLRKEITKSPVFYFQDLGLRNLVLGSFGNLDKNQDLGFLFQNFVLHNLNEITKLYPTRVHFWRTKDGAEVDFVVEKGLEPIPIEVKYKNFEKPEVAKSLRSFIEKYHPQKAFVVNLGFEKKVKLQKTNVYFIPFWKLGEYLS